MEYIAMPKYVRCPSSLTPFRGAIIIRLYRSGDLVKAYVRQTTSADHADNVASEELEPDDAFRLANNKLSHREQPIYVELADGLPWDPSWGTLDD